MPTKIQPFEFPCPRHGQLAQVRSYSPVDGYELTCYADYVRSHGLTDEEQRKMVDAWPDAPDPHADCKADLDAAQDEIEARILASERDRELIRQLGVVVDHMAPAAYKAIMAAGGVV